MEVIQLVLDYPASIGSSENLKKEVKRVIWGQWFTQYTARLIPCFKLGSSRIVFSHCCHKAKVKTTRILFESLYITHFWLYRPNTLGKLKKKKTTKKFNATEELKMWAVEPQHLYSNPPSNPPGSMSWASYSVPSLCLGLHICKMRMTIIYMSHRC